MIEQKEKDYIINQLDNIEEIGELSDGYHTFNSLYNQRLVLFAALVNAYKDRSWKSRCHDDGEPCFDGNWFIVGIETPEGQYTYHYKLRDWSLFDCKVLDKAPLWDGHTDKNVTRLLTLQWDRWIYAGKRLPENPRRVIVYGEVGSGSHWKGIGSYEDDGEAPAWRLFGCPFNTCKIIWWTELIDDPLTGSI